jgi:hypothetical protein
MLVHGKERPRVVMAVVGYGLVNEIGGKPLHSVVEFVLQQMTSNVGQHKVRPVGELNTVEVLVVLNHEQTIFQSLRV